MKHKFIDWMGVLYNITKGIFNAYLTARRIYSGVLYSTTKGIFNGAAQVAIIKRVSYIILLKVFSTFFV